MRVAPITAAPAQLPIHKGKARILDDDYYCSLTSERSTRSTSQRGPVRRWLARYPRVGFMLVLILCAFCTGAYTSYLMASWTLRFAGATTALALAKTQLAATEAMLRNSSACVAAHATANAFAIKMQMAVTREPWQEATRQRTARLRSLRQEATRCIDQHVAMLATYSSKSESRSCLQDGVAAISVNTNSSSTVKSYVQRLHQLLTPTMPDELASNEAVVDRLSSLASNATNNTMKLLSVWLQDLQDALVDDLGNVDTDFAAIVPTLDLVLPLRGELAVWTPTFQLLRSIVGGDDHLLDQLTQSWTKMETTLSRMSDRESALRHDLETLGSTTSQLLTNTTMAIEHAILSVQNAIQAELQDSMHSLIADISVMLVARPVVGRTIQNEDELVAGRQLLVPTPTSGALDALLHDWNATKHATDTAPTARFDLTEFWRSVVDWWPLVVRWILTLDMLSRIRWLLEKATALFTESYLDMEPVDIRDITPITTLLDVWGVFKCRHNPVDVLYSLVTDGVYMLETAIHFVLWVMVAGGGTMAMVHWQERHVTRCHSTAMEEEGDAAPATDVNVLKWIARLFTETRVLVPPSTLIRKQSKQLHAAVAEDERVWRNYTATVDRRLADQVGEAVALRQLVADLNGVATNCSLRVSDCEMTRFDMSTLTMDTPVHMNADLLGDLALWHDAIAATCVDPAASSTQSLLQLEHIHGCALDQTLYLWMATWWMVLVISLSLRFISRMVVKSLGLTWWSSLGGGQLHFIALCDVTGEFSSPERLPKAVRRHLRNVKWRVAARMVGVAAAVASAVAVGVLVLPSQVMLLPVT